MKRNNSNSHSKFTKKAVKNAKPARSTNTSCPRFSFEYMIDQTGYSLNCCNQDECSQFSKKLFQLGRMTWQEINSAGRHQLGTEKIPRSSIKKQGILKNIPEDATILSWRYNGKAPMLGFRDDTIFHVICLDHDFSVYDHGV